MTQQYLSSETKKRVKKWTCQNAVYKSVSNLKYSTFLVLYNWQPINCPLTNDPVTLMLSVSLFVVNLRMSVDMARTFLTFRLQNILQIYCFQIYLDLINSSLSKGDNFGLRAKQTLAEICSIFLLILVEEKKDFTKDLLLFFAKFRKRKKYSLPKIHCFFRIV